MRAIAHRGLSGLYPENTIASFRGAVDTGCDAIELDVQRTKDGKLVVIHDEALNRTTDMTGTVTEHYYEELRQANAANGFETGFFHIPTLEEFFEFMRDRPQFIELELKNSICAYPNIENEIVQMIRCFNLSGRIELFSFNHISMLECKRLAPDIPCGLSVSCHMINPGAYTRSAGMDFINMRQLAVTAEVVKEIHGNGVRVYPWTVDAPEDLRRLIALDVDGIMSNRVDILMDIPATPKS